MPAQLVGWAAHPVRRIAKAVKISNGSIFDQRRDVLLPTVLKNLLLRKCVQHIQVQVRDRVVSTGVQWMTARNALNGQPPTAPDAIAAERLISILGTGWFEATCGGQNTRKRHLIKADQGKKQPFHTHVTLFHRPLDPQPGPTEQTGQCLLYVWLFDAPNIGASDEHNIPSRLNVIVEMPGRLSQQTSGPVALHCIANLAAGRYSDPRSTELIRTSNQHQQRVRPRLPLCINPAHVHRAPQPHLSFHTLSSHPSGNESPD